MHTILAALLGVLFLMPPRPGVKLSDEAWRHYKELSLNNSRAFLEGSVPNVLSVKGKKFFPVVIMDYSNTSSAYKVQDFQQMLFDGPWISGTAHDYYNEVSYGKVDLSGKVYGPYTADNPSGYYANDNYGIGNDYPRCAGALVYEACLKSDPFVDYSIYDNDGDGYVDIFTVIHAGYGAEESDNKNDIWSHEFSLSGWQAHGGPGPYKTDDGVMIDVYTINPELSSYSISDSISNIGVFCHEWGHGFGLPDLYITEGKYAGKAGLGQFCLMASGSWGGEGKYHGSSPVHLCAWCKYFLGWLEPKAVEPGGLEAVQGAQLSSVSTSPSAYRIYPNPSGVDWSFTSVGSGEYFLVENRQQTGFDKGLPGSGLLILHVDESQANNSNIQNPLVGIMQADGDSRYLFTSDAGQASDLWKNDEEGFSNFSTPSSRFYSGLPSGISITAISPSKENMTADIVIKPPLLGSIYSYPNPFNPHETDYVTIVYQPTSSNKTGAQFPKFRVMIYDLSGKRVRVLNDEGEVNIYRRVAFWDGNNDWGRPVASGLYFYIVETLEGDVVKERSKSMLTMVR